MRIGNAFVSCLEYETAWALGANCGVDDLDWIAEMTRECNDVGLDTIEAGNTLAIAMEGGVIPFGDGEAAMDLLLEVQKGTPHGTHHRPGRGSHRQGLWRAPRADLQSTSRCRLTSRAPSRALA